MLTVTLEDPDRALLTNFLGWHRSCLINSAGEGPEVRELLSVAKSGTSYTLTFGEPQ